jgi:hypothetical protein
LGAVHAQPDGSYRFDAEVGEGVVMGLAAPYAYEEATPEENRPGGPAVAAPTLPGPASAHMSVVSAGDGFDVITSVDADWLEGKSFPIVLDPTVTFSHAAGTMLAGFGAYKAKSGSCGGTCPINTTSADLAAGTFTNENKDWQPGRSFMRFDLSAIPPGSKVSSAELGLYTNACLGDDTNDPTIDDYYCDQNSYTVNLQQLNGAWGSSSTYNDLSAITSSSAFASYSTPPFTVSGQCSAGCFWMKFAMADQVQRWVNRSVVNHGFAVKLLDESLPNLGGPYWSHLGQRGTAIGNPPYLKVTHTANAPSALEKLGGISKDQSPSSATRPRTPSTAPPATSGTPSPTCTCPAGAPT